MKTFYHSKELVIIRLLQLHLLLSTCLMQFWMEMFSGYYARFFGIQIPVDTTEGKKMFSALARDLIDTTNPASYNQAIMDFGAVICKPLLPLCNKCPLQKKCIAYTKKMVNILPVKEKTSVRRERFFNYLIVEHDNKIYVNKRTDKDIWQNLYEFILDRN